ncbi:unnamed protein product [Arabidopsis thaliana]|uniref:(thale cress) hypothetical protein n=1 Tax=Arabidopsis thaliana TaxID=3702 RepID=A0A7G2E6N0_ARATH|nr:unnamed protein product [Arabidopsis thaliana]
MSDVIETIIILHSLPVDTINRHRTEHQEEVAETLAAISSTVDCYVAWSPANSDGNRCNFSPLSKSIFKNIMNESSSKFSFILYQCEIKLVLLLLSSFFFGEVKAISTKQPKHRKLGNREGDENRSNEIVVQMKARVKRSKSKRGPQKKEPYKKPPCSPPTHPA